MFFLAAALCLAVVTAVPCRRSAPTLSAPFEILDGALVLLRLRTRVEGAEVSRPAGAGVLAPGVQTILSALEFSDHVSVYPAKACSANRRTLHAKAPLIYKLLHLRQFVSASALASSTPAALFPRFTRCTGSSCKAWATM